MMREQYNVIKDINVGVLEQMAGLDLEAALARVEGDEELLKEVAGMFLEQCPETLSEIRDAIVAKDPKALQRSAHALKGSVGNFGAQGAYDAAYRLERMGRKGEFDQCPRALVELEDALQVLESQLAKLTSE